MTATAHLLKAGMELDAVPHLLLAALEIDHHPVSPALAAKIRSCPIRKPQQRSDRVKFFL